MKPTRIIPNFCAAIACVIFFTSCAGGAAPASETPSSSTTFPDPTTFTCDPVNDCDHDGVFSSCDMNDLDHKITSLKFGCDEETDGFADVPCDGFEFVRDKNHDGRIEINERDVNCDVCPGVFDPDQADEDLNGVGDACSFSPNIGFTEAPPVAPAAPTTPPTLIDDTNENEAQIVDDELTGTIELEVEDADTTMREGGSFDASLVLTNQTNRSLFTVETILRKSKTGLTAENFCVQNNVCISLADEKIEVAQGSKLAFDLDLATPDDLELGEYRVLLRITANEMGEEAPLEEVLLSDPLDVLAALKFEAYMLPADRILDLLTRPSLYLRDDFVVVR